jgi:hypothetical protein
VGGGLIGPGRQAGRDLARGAAVELGRAAGPRPPPLPEPPEGRLQQAGLDQLVQVEGGQAALHPDRLGGLVAADLALGGGHVAVEGPAHRVLEESDGGQVPVGGQLVHAVIVKPRAVAFRAGGRVAPWIVEDARDVAVGRGKGGLKWRRWVRRDE